MIFLPTDVLFLGMTIVFLLLGIIYRQDPSLQRIYRQLSFDPWGLWALMTFVVFWFIAVLDSIHFASAESTQGIQSVLDMLLQPLFDKQELGYSLPFATHSFQPTIEHLVNGHWQSTVMPLDINQGQVMHIGFWLFLWCSGVIVFSGLCYAAFLYLSKPASSTWQEHSLAFIKGNYPRPWRTLGLGCLFLFASIWGIIIFAPHFHLLGTDKIGNDLLVEVIKSIRTAMILGIVTSLITMPIALCLGALSGLLGGWVDDIIYYIYTTLSSIPGILLIAASVLSLQIYWYNHPLTTSLPIVKADFRLLALCVILGLTSWTQLCRVLRAQTLKLRELDYILASRIQGVSTWRILSRHIMPQLLPILLISLVLDFSGLVLAEAVLTYVGVGVDPLTPSFGNLIDGARVQMAQTPVVWWPLTATLVVMLLLVFAVNILADSVQQALNPRAPDAS